MICCRNFNNAKFTWLLLWMSLPALWAADPLYLELSAKGDKTELGLAEFSTAKSQVNEAALARQIREVVKSDLLFTRLFTLVEGGASPLKKKISFERQ